jgi:transcriptional regulator with XRE-family HTH domain
MKRDNELGELLQRRRLMRGYSLRELGGLARVDHAYIQCLENGSKRLPSRLVLMRLINALRISGKDIGRLLKLIELELLNRWNTTK